jgi:tetratricopeptide (TPR) repeat protein
MGATTAGSRAQPGVATKVNATKTDDLRRRRALIAMLEHIAPSPSLHRSTNARRAKTGGDSRETAPGGVWPAPRGVEHAATIADERTGLRFREARPLSRRATVAAVGARPVLEGYSLGKRLGSGAEGEVFEAVRTRDGLPVAIKRLAFVTGARDGSLAYESALLRAFSHPNVVRVLDVCRGNDGAPYLVMEALRGCTLAARLERGPLRWREAVDLGIRIGGALESLHGEGLVHGDVSPANVFLREGRVGSPCLLDLHASPRGGWTDISLPVTVAFMSPERARSTEPDPADDVWSLSVMMYASIAGASPFTASTVAMTLYRIAHVTPAIDREGFDVPEALVDFFARALTRERSRRLCEAGELVRTLATVMRSASEPPARPLLDWPAGATSLACETVACVVRSAVDPDAVAQMASRAGSSATRLINGSVIAVFRDGSLEAAALPKALAFGWRVTELAQGVAVARGACPVGDGQGDLEALVARANRLSRSPGMRIDASCAQKVGTAWVLSREDDEFAVLGPVAAGARASSRHRAPSTLAEGLDRAGERGTGRRGPRRGAPDETTPVNGADLGSLLERLCDAAGAEIAAERRDVELIRLLDALPARSRATLAGISVLGRDATRAALEALGGGWPDAEGLVRSGLARMIPSPDSCSSRVELRDGSVGAAALSLLREDRRRQLHARAAHHLLAAPVADAAVVAEHFERAGALERAAEWWVRATEQRAGAGRIEEARACLDRLRSCPHAAPQRWRALTALDDSMQPSGDRSLQRATLAELDGLAAELGGAAEREAHWRWCNHARMVGDAALAEARGRSATHRAPDECRWAISARAELALLFAEQRRFDEARDASNTAAASRREEADPWTAARALHAQAYVAIEAGVDLPQGARLYRRAAALYRRGHDRRREAIARVNLGVALMQQCRFGEALDAYECARSVAGDAGNRRAAAVAGEGIGAALRCLGEVEDATEVLLAALAEADELQHPRLAEASLVELAYVSIVRGDEALGALCERRLSVIPDAGVASRARLAGRTGRPANELLSACESICVSAERGPLERIEAAAALVDLRVERGRTWFESAITDYVSEARSPLGRSIRHNGVQARFCLGQIRDFT